MQVVDFGDAGTVVRVDRWGVRRIVGCLEKQHAAEGDEVVRIIAAVRHGRRDGAAGGRVVDRQCRRIEIPVTRRVARQAGLGEHQVVVEGRQRVRRHRVVVVRRIEHIVRRRGDLRQRRAVVLPDRRGSAGRVGHRDIRVGADDRRRYRVIDRVAQECRRGCVSGQFGDDRPVGRKQRRAVGTREQQPLRCHTRSPSTWPCRDRAMSSLNLAAAQVGAVSMAAAKPRSAPRRSSGAIEAWP